MYTKMVHASSFMTPFIIEDKNGKFPIWKMLFEPKTERIDPLLNKV